MRSCGDWSEAKQKWRRRSAYAGGRVLVGLCRLRLVGLLILAGFALRPIAAMALTRRVTSLLRAAYFIATASLCLGAALLGRTCGLGGLGGKAAVTEAGEPGAADQPDSEADAG